jgi:hypothetical protein
MRAVLALLTILVVAVGSVTAQQQQQLSTQQAEAIIIKPKLTLGDVKIVTIFIGSVDIRGNEVDAFLDVKQTLTKATDAATKAGKRDEDVIVVDMRLDTAQNFFLLMQRATLKAADAEKFKAILTAIQEAARQVQGQR